jgi:hypothetical protein
MRRLLRGVLIGSAFTLAAGLVLHLAGWPVGDRVIALGLVALVSIPVANTAVAMFEEIQRR